MGYALRGKPEEGIASPLEAEQGKKVTSYQLLVTSEKTRGRIASKENIVNSYQLLVTSKKPEEGLASPLEG